MSKVTANLAISLDGYVAGPDQSAEDPLGRGGMRVHEWAFATRAWHEMNGKEGGQPGPDSDAFEELTAGVGAFIMGRNMFGPIRGEWTGDWRGWWGDEPPYHTPVFVLTHHPRDPLEMQGGTTFHFVTDGIEAALERARDAAGDRNVDIAGGASAVRQYLAAGHLDELTLHIVPVVLGAGERLLDGVGEQTLELVKTVPSPNVTHVTYRVVR